jgi:DNA-binding MarR family transcriptional regulator
MNNKEFFIKASQGILTEDMIIYAQVKVAEIGYNKTKHRNAATNDDLTITDARNKILSIVKENPKGIIARDIASKIDTTPQKVASVCRKLVEEDLIKTVDYREVGRGAIKKYLPIIHEE